MLSLFFVLLKVVIGALELEPGLLPQLALWGRFCHQVAGKLSLTELEQLETESPVVQLLAVTKCTVYVHYKDKFD